MAMTSVLVAGWLMALLPTLSELPEKVVEEKKLVSHPVQQTQESGASQAGMCTAPQRKVITLKYISLITKK